MGKVFKLVFMLLIVLFIVMIAVAQFNEVSVKQKKVIQELNIN